MYQKVPEPYNFNSEFPTWIIGFCPDTASFFVTNKRFFYYEFEKEFINEREGIEYFEQHLTLFNNIQEKLMEYLPSFLKNSVQLDNTGKIYKI